MLVLNSSYICFQRLLFRFPIIGLCKQPKALGPYTIKLGDYTSIKFRNPFHETTNFILDTEPSVFTLEAKNISVREKSDYNIKVTVYNSKEYEIIGKYPISGKLTIIADQCKCPNVCDIKWVYYLQAIM